MTIKIVLVAKMRCKKRKYFIHEPMGIAAVVVSAARADWLMKAVSEKCTILPSHL